MAKSTKACLEEEANRSLWNPDMKRDYSVREIYDEGLKDGKTQLARDLLTLASEAKSKKK